MIASLPNNANAAADLRRHPKSNMTEIAHVHTADDLKQVKVLFQEYAESLGFQPTQPYCHNPIPGAMYFQLKLTNSKDGITNG